MLLEVKTVGDRGVDFLETRISFRQRKRLLLTREWLEDQEDTGVAIGAAFVRMGPAGEIRGLRVTLLD